MTDRQPQYLRGALAALGATVLLSGCAGPNPRDPYEGFNRAMFSFNDTVDQVALKPAATAYRKVLPSFVQTGVSNFFGNLSDAWTAVNNLLQGKAADGFSDVTRFTLNSTVGILGLFDVASATGLPKHNEDFGQTLGTWGFTSGPYLMLPLLGPSTVRDTVALPLDISGDIWRYKEPTYLRNIGTVVRVVDQRANLLDASSLLEDAALDRYEFIRDGFLQRRESKIHDGESAPRSGKDATAGLDDYPVPRDGGETATMPATTAAAAETSAPVSSEPAPNELNSGTPAATNASL